ncbi:MAG: NTP transferase domain-containing protein [bacterium]
MSNFAVILCGGKSKRFDHQNKALIKYKNISFIKRIAKNLENLPIENIIISTKENLKNELFEESKDFGNKIKFVIDIVDFDGPLAGIISVLQYFKDGNFLFTTVDRIFIDYEDLLKFFDFSGVLAVFSKVENNLLPLPVLYNAKIIYLWEIFKKNKPSSFSIKSWNEFILNFLEKDLIAFVNFKERSKTLIDINNWQEYYEWCRE